MRFRSKVDSWVVGVMILAVGGGSLFALYAVVSEGVLGLIPLAISPALITWLLAIPTRYELGQEHLQIRSGLLRWRIPYHKIERVEEARDDWASGPAWSLDRLRITYNGGRIVRLSPVSRARFVAELEAKTQGCASAKLTNACN